MAKCNSNQGGIKMEPVDLDVLGEPSFTKARPIPYGLRAAVKNTIDDLVADGILQPVPSSTWATPIVTPLKPDGRPRVCGDFRLINQQLRQTASTTPEVEDMFQGLEGNKVFSKIDLSNAFLQVPLKQSAKEVTTLNTPWGLYQHQFLPFGLNVSPGIFQKSIDHLLSGLSNTRAYQDDIIVYGKSKQEHDKHLLRLLQTLNEANVRINAKKSEIGVKKLKYLGYIINGEGISADKERVKALSLAPKPSSAEQLRSFLGFAQYYSKFVPNFSNLTITLYDLLSKDFTWTAEADKAYKSVIKALTDSIILTSFQLGAPTDLIVDASQYAIGAMLEQNGKPITCISRKLTPAESHYSQTQKEALAIHWAVTRLHKFLFGNPFRIITDHRALEYIFNPDSAINKTTCSMLQRWALHLSAYNYSILHKPGKELQADYLSRHAYFPKEVDVSEDEIYLTNPLPVSRNLLINETQLAYGPVKAGLNRGWSNSARRRFPKLYANRSDLHLQADGVITFHDRILIPPSLRNEMLTHLHMSHLGRDKMVSLARMLCWWPSITLDIQTFCKECRACAKKPKTHPNWHPWPVTFTPMQRVHADYCGPLLGQYYALVIEDSFSKFPEVFLTTSATADFTKKAMQKFFAREGIPQVLITDNGTHFSAIHLQKWLKSLGCTPVFTAPRHPSSNGLAENFIKTLKTAINAALPKNFDDLNRAMDTFLLQYRNAVHPSTGKSPAKLFKGRNLRCVNSLDTSDVLFYRGNESRPCEGLILGPIGNRMFNILDRADGSVHKRHIEQISFSPPDLDHSHLPLHTPDRTQSRHLPSDPLPRPAPLPPVPLPPSSSPGRWEPTQPPLPVLPDSSSGHPDPAPPLPVRPPSDLPPISEPQAPMSPAAADSSRDRASPQKRERPTRVRRPPRRFPEGEEL